MLAVFSRFHEVGPFTFVVAFLAGVISFLSPCVLPLVPGYLSIVTGLDIADLEAPRAAQYRRIAGTTGLFVLGFALVNIPLGITASLIGSTFQEHQVLLTRIGGVFVLAFSAFLIGSVFLKAPWLYREFKLHPRLGALGWATPIVVGAAFAFGWSPCVGPIYGSILTLAGESGRAGTGAALLAFYTLGLGVPFLVCGLALGTLRPLLLGMRKHLPAVVIGSALVMAVFGVLLVTNQLADLERSLSTFLRDHGLGWIVDLG